MKAASSLFGAASAVFLSLCVVFSGSVAVQLASVSSAQAAVVSRIDVRGNERVESDTIRDYIGIRPGVSFNSSAIDEAVKRLFSTNLFSEVQINQRGSVLVVVVAEYQIVNQVIFQGNRKIKDAQLASAVQLQPRGSFSEATMQADIGAVEAAYSRIGRDDARVTAYTQDLGGGRVNVIFEITEGGRTKIASINFVGNNAYRDGRLQDIIQTKKSNFLSFLSRKDVFDEAQLRVDEELLRRFYYNRGYADFQIISSSADLDETENKYTITFTVDEGERYTFGSIEIDSTIPGVDAQSLERLVETRSGDTYSASDVEDTLVAITERLAGQGYPFAQVTPRGDRDFVNRTISVLYTIDQGPRAYIERIEIRGNTKTRDFVIRREFDVSEGDAFNQVLIQQARKRLEALDFFASVDISTAQGSGPDQVILIVDVEDKSTGEFSIGAGYATGNTPTSGFLLEAGVSERNFLGRGQAIRLSVSGGSSARDYMISFTEPYFLGRRVSAGFDIFRQTRSYTNYTSTVTGGTVRLGLPITEHLSTTFAYNLAVESYAYSAACDANGDGIADAGCAIAAPIVTAVTTQSPWTKSSISATLTYSTIDNIQDPRNGLHATFTTEFAGIFGNARFIKVSGRANYYKTLSEELDLVGVLVAGGGHVQALGVPLRVFDYNQSTTRIIRGFAHNGIGPFDTATGEHLGGATYFHASAEMQFPLPLLPKSFGLRGAVFADAATVYGNALATAAGTTMAWRASVGASVIWASPFGPLRVDYAIPVARTATDTVQNFNFGISTRF
ncbi:outer membrane protein assembly factor BamA [Mesorhizobium sp. Z1-4]|uniref:outer membrane protein assembly factor BamA n=1 Tax=Mesorhizobium sp. Z1-4 TaxID=2448478 RepID=UPI000FD7AF81|nr:outer membrane protein assembly factor BamA [Mesorhizobium sp. Z1-4]